MISSKKKVIEMLDNGFKIEESRQFRRTLSYLTNYKDKEETVSKGVMSKLREAGLIDSNNDYKPTEKQHEKTLF